MIEQVSGPKGAKIVWYHMAMIPKMNCQNCTCNLQKKINVISTTLKSCLGVLPVFLILGLREYYWKYYTTFTGVLPQKWYSASGSTGFPNYHLINLKCVRLKKWPFGYCFFNSDVANNVYWLFLFVCKQTQFVFILMSSFWLFMSGEWVSEKFICTIHRSPVLNHLWEKIAQIH